MVIRAVSAIAALVAGTWIYSEHKYGTDPISYWRYPIVKEAKFKAYEESDVFAVRFSADGQRLITQSAADRVRTERLDIWNAQTFKRLDTIEDPSISINDIRISDDQRRIVATGLATSLQVWDGQTGQMRPILTGIEGLMQRPTLSPDGRLIAGIQYEHRTQQWHVKLWDAQTGEAKMAIAHQPEALRAIAFNPASNLLAIAADDAIQFWDIAAQTQLRTVPFERAETYKESGQFEAIADISFNNDGKLLTVRSDRGQLEQIDVATGKTLYTLDRYLRSYSASALSPDGKRLAVLIWKSKEERYDIELVDIEKDETVATLKNVEDVTGLAFSPDGNTLAAEFRRKITLYDIATGQPLPLPPIENYGYGFTFTPDAQALLVMSRGGSVSEISLQTGEANRQFLSPQAVLGQDLLSPQLSQTATTLIATARVPVLNIWEYAQSAQPSDVVSSEGQNGEIQQLTTHRLSPTYSPKQLALSSKGEKFAISNFLKADDEMRVTAVGSSVSGDILRTFPAETLPLDIALSPDGETLATYHEDYNIQLWNTNTGERLHHFVEDDPVSDRRAKIAFSPDGTLFAASNKESIRLWQTETQELVQTLRIEEIVQPSSDLGFRWDSQVLAISPDNTWIAISDEQARLHFIEISTGELVRTLHYPDNHRGLMDIALSPDGQTLAGGTYRGDILIWRLPSRFSLL